MDGCESKWCQKGKHYAPIAEFAKNDGMNDGLAYSCRYHKALYDRAYQRRRNARLKAERARRSSEIAGD